MNNYLAKSNPIETIQEHTDRLIKNYEILRSMYPVMQINWYLLKTACLYHDLGKMNLKFQSKIEGIKKYSNEIAHNLLSIAFLDTKYLKTIFTEEEIKILVQAIAYHHDRGNYDDENYNAEVELLKEEIKNFEYNKVSLENVKKISIKYFSNNRTYSDQKEFMDYVKIKGLLNRLDYAASSNISVEIENNFLNAKLQKLDYKWNDLQNFMINNRENNVVVVAQTGMGKTEAGLLWIGDNKGFFTLPLKTAINQIYDRIRNNIIKENKELVGLLHSDTYSEYMRNDTEDSDIERYFIKTKQLSLPLTICTLDQLFDVVFRYRDFEPKLATMSYSKIVIDEVQMYSDDLLSHLILGLSYITQIGGKFAILTATLPEIIIDLLRKEGIDFKTEKPFINNEEIRHSLKVVEDDLDSECIIDKFNNNKILVICNTVKKAQKTYEELCNSDILRRQKVNINLLHGKFIKIHRKEKEDAIFKFGQLDNKERGIWITTQVVEASLDIDFELLFTELSDVNGLFQRMGRCNRKGKRGIEKYNCYVFDGGKRSCSGVGNFIDEKIFELSKDALKGIDGKISEQQKLEAISKVYTTDILKDTEYYKRVTENIEYIKSITEYELSKKEVRKRFRNIDNITVIPKQVYLGNKKIIQENLAIYKSNAEKRIRIEAREKILRYTVDLNYREAEKRLDNNETVEISKYEIIKILECDYSKEIGVVIAKEKKEEDKIKVVSNIL
ncbi:MAG TPA: CRISPR-associated helicase/endonuclease Cas3 [Clostridiales bacterium]|nr:MAG: CRISPR-associated helicase/endonuclease Cas3 [Clostridiales bacterium GWD2_32_59]HAN10257.1 CRISPR-associated helicase/endonuclease Cas3 [Clostridiales bacterium]